MKKLILLPFLILLLSNSSSANSFTSLWWGAGVTQTNNFGIGQSAGLTYYFGIANGIGLGVQGFMQKYDMYYDKQQYATVGASMRYSGNYVYIAPMFVSHVVKSGATQAYVSIGLGFKAGGYDSLAKWAYTSWEDPSFNYDSMIDNSKLMQQMTYRIGFGMTHYYTLGGKLKLSITEDIGILPKSLTSGTAPADNREIATDFNRFYKPIYYTLRIGLTYRTPSASDRARRRTLR